MGERVSCWKARNMLANQLVKRQEKERLKDKTFLRHFIAAFWSLHSAPTMSVISSLFGFIKREWWHQVTISIRVYSILSFLLFFVNVLVWLYHCCYYSLCVSRKNVNPFSVFLSGFSSHLIDGFVDLGPLACNQLHLKGQERGKSIFS